MTKRGEETIEKAVRKKIEDEMFDRILSMDELTPQAKQGILGISKAYYYIKLREFRDKEAKGEILS